MVTQMTHASERIRYKSFIFWKVCSVSAFCDAAVVLGSCLSEPQGDLKEAAGRWRSNSDEPRSSRSLFEVQISLPPIQLWFNTLHHQMLFQADKGSVMSHKAAKQVCRDVLMDIGPPPAVFKVPSIRCVSQEGRKSPSIFVVQRFFHVALPC